MTEIPRIRYVVGDATDPTEDLHTRQVVAHIINDGGYWNRGFARAIADRYPKVKHAHNLWRLGWWQGSRVPPSLGHIQFVQVGPFRHVANMVAQRGLYHGSFNPEPLDYMALEQCLQRLKQWCENITTGSIGPTVHMPKIGSGLARGDWNRVEQMITSQLSHFDIQVTVYTTEAYESR